MQWRDKYHIFHDIYLKIKAILNMNKLKRGFSHYRIDGHRIDAYRIDGYLGGNGETSSNACF